jgi:hypothetical protein
MQRLLAGEDPEVVIPCARPVILGRFPEHPIDLTESEDELDVTSGKGADWAKASMVKRDKNKTSSSAEGKPIAIDISRDGFLAPQPDAAGTPRRILEQKDTETQEINHKEYVEDLLLMAAKITDRGISYEDHDQTLEELTNFLDGRLLANNESAGIKETKKHEIDLLMEKPNGTFRKRMRDEDEETEETMLPANKVLKATHFQIEHDRNELAAKPDEPRAADENNNMADEDYIDILDDELFGDDETDLAARDYIDILDHELFGDDETDLAARDYIDIPDDELFGDDETDLADRVVGPIIIECDDDIEEGLRYD